MYELSPSYSISTCVLLAMHQMLVYASAVFAVINKCSSLGMSD